MPGDKTVIAFIGELMSSTAPDNFNVDPISVATAIQMPWQMDRSTELLDGMQKSRYDNL